MKKKNHILSYKQYHIYLLKKKYSRNKYLIQTFASGYIMFYISIGTQIYVHINLYNDNNIVFSPWEL